MSTLTVISTKYSTAQAEYARVRSALNHVLAKLKSIDLSRDVNQSTIKATVTRVDRILAAVDCLGTANSLSDINLRQLQNCSEMLMSVNAVQTYLTDKEVCSVF
jgi:hypothetical protein